MKTSEVIKKIARCPQRESADLKEHKLFGKIFRRGANIKNEFLQEGFQAEMEGQPVALPPGELLPPIF